jgi:hypothetical protein
MTSGYERVTRRIGRPALLFAAATGLAAAAVLAVDLASSRPSAGVIPTSTPAAAMARLDGLRTAPPATSIPADCVPKPSGPPGSPYQLGIVGSIDNGLLSAGSATVFNVSAKFCAVVTLVNGTPPCAATGSVSAPADGQVFGSMSATLTLVPGLAPAVPFVAHPGTITGGFSCQSSSGGLPVHLTAVVSASTGLYGLSCTIGPLTIPLSGTLTGPLTHASVTLKSDDFAVPGVSSSSACSGEVPADFDEIAGLPIAAGGASVVLPATVELYRPGS